MENHTAKLQTDWSGVLERLADGDPRALARVTSVIRGLLARMHATDLQAIWDDIAQDVIVALLSSLRRGALRDSEAFVGYCAVITRNALARRLTQLGRARAVKSDVEVDDIAETARRDRDLDLLLDVLSGLDALPRRVQAVLAAIYLEGRSYQEASSALGLPLGSLKRIQTRGLCLLRGRFVEPSQPSVAPARAVRSSSLVSRVPSKPSKLITAAAAR